MAAHVNIYHLHEMLSVRLSACVLTLKVKLVLPSSIFSSSLLCFFCLWVYTLGIHKHIFYMKNFKFMRLIYFKFLSQIKGNSINDFVSSKVL